MRRLTVGDLRQNMQRLQVLAKLTTILMLCNLIGCVHLSSASNPIAYPIALESKKKLSAIANSKDLLLNYSGMNLNEVAKQKKLEMDKKRTEQLCSEGQYNKNLHLEQLLQQQEQRRNLPGSKGNVKYQTTVSPIKF